jgi:hypothetical protein
MFRIEMKMQKINYFARCNISKITNVKRLIKIKSGIRVIFLILRFEN